MDISYFELIVLNAAFLGILWLTLSSRPKSPFSSKLQYSSSALLLMDYQERDFIARGQHRQAYYLILMRQTLTGLALSQALPSCQEGRGGQFGNLKFGTID